MFVMEKKQSKTIHKKTLYEEYDADEQPLTNNRDTVPSNAQPIRISKKETEDLRKLVQNEENPLSLQATTTQADLL